MTAPTGFTTRCKPKCCAPGCRTPSGCAGTRCSRAIWRRRRERRDTEALIRLADHHFAAGHAEDAFVAALRAATAAEASSAYAEAIRLVRHAVDLLPTVTQTALSRADLLRRVRALGELSGDIAAERGAIDDLLAALDSGSSRWTPRS